jgi:hypothetical protein
MTERSSATEAQIAEAVMRRKLLAAGGLAAILAAMPRRAESAPAPLPEGGFIDASKAPFSARGDGVSDDTAAIQSALDSGSAVVFLPNPRVAYMIGSLTLPAGVALRGQSKYKTILRKAGAISRALVSGANGASGYNLEELTLDGQSGAEPQSLFHHDNGGSNSLVRRVVFRNGMQRWALRSDWSSPQINIAVKDCDFENCPHGGIAYLAKVAGHRRITVENCHYEGCGSNLMIFHNNDGAGPDYFIGVRVNGNRIVNCANTGSDGPIPFEHWGCTDYECSGNYINTGTRGLCAGSNMRRANIRGNVVVGQSDYGTEAGTCSEVVIADNVFVNCARGISFNSRGPIANVLIADNLFLGTGLSSYNATNPSYGIWTAPPTQASGLFVRNNVFADLEFARVAVQINGQSNGTGTFVEISGNTLLARTPNSFVGSIEATADFAVVRDNLIVRTAKLDATHYAAAAGPAFVHPPNHPVPGPLWICERNRIHMQGESALGFLAAIGADAKPSIAHGLIIRDNVVSGNFGKSGAIHLPFGGSDTIVSGNETGGVRGQAYYFGSPVAFKDLFHRITQAVAMNAAGGYRAMASAANIVLSTDALATRAGGSQVLTLIHPGVGPGDLVQMTLAGGTNASGIPFWRAVASEHAIAITLSNLHASQFFNGTFVFNVQITKAA